MRCVLINMFLSLFAMNQRYGCLHCTKTLAMIRIKRLFQLFRANIFFSLRQVKKKKKKVVSVVFAPSRDFLVLKRPFDACPKSGVC